ncbi:MAG: redoxin family protein [Hyphomicrobiales bacterium]
MSANTAKPLRRAALIIGVALIAAALYWFAGSAGKNQSQDNPPAQAAVGENALKPMAVGPMAALLVATPPKDVPPFTFQDATGASKSLSDFKGRVVLLNLWATWCAPCRKEMPSLASLQKDMGGPGFEVVALSLDHKGLEASGAFLKETGADALALYADPESKALAAVGALGLPATLLITRDGKEAARLLGPAEWNSAEAKALISQLLK